MRARCWLLLITLLHAGLVAADSVQQGVRWQPNLETAKRVAAQSNRLVLVHFWVDPCQPCKRMQEEVFSRDDVASTLEANFVPVQVNAQYFPRTAREFGVEKFPTDVIITPAGDVVTKSVGAFPAPQYRDRLSRIAATVRGQAPTANYAQAPSDPVPGGPSMSGGARGQVNDFGQQYPPSVGWPAGPGPAQYAGGAPEGYATPPWGAGYQPPTPSAVPGSRNVPGWTNQQAARPGPGPLTPPFGNETPASYQGPGGPPQNPPAQGPQPQGPLPRGMAGTTSVQPFSPAAPPPGVAPRQGEPPPLGLDGYCPVQLLENNRWVRGTHEGGVIHRDRLYLCATPEERRRFMANPDLYAPVLAGCDVVLAVDQNQLVPGQRKYGVRYEKDNRIYLFASQGSRDRFAQDPGRYAAAVTRGMAATSRRTVPSDNPYADNRYGMAPNFYGAGDTQSR